MRRALTRFLLGAAVAVSGLACTSAGPASAAPVAPSFDTVVPAPVSVRKTSGTFTLKSTTKIYAPAGQPQTIGAYVHDFLSPSTGYALPVAALPAGGPPANGISLTFDGAGADLGDQGYRLDSDTNRVVVRANTPAGLFAGVQTLRQVLPAKAEKRTVQTGPWTVPGGNVIDKPRFAERGSMLDVARHFMPVADVKRYLDNMSLYKMNKLHLHLADDQGWRIQIDSWPRLTTYGGSTEVGGGPGGFYTKAQYADIVAYAQARYIEIVPEIDMPGHTNAALASYAELNCNGVAPPLYTGTDVGFSSLCVGKEITYKFVEDVVRELAAMTPGRYLHLGGDEAHSTPPADYQTFMQRVVPLAKKYGKTAVGWNEIAKTTTDPSVVPQFWDTVRTNADLPAAVQRGTKVLMSPANKTYIDMKYNASTPYGLKWAGYIEVKTAYDWDPGTWVTGVPESAVLGVEAPMWSENIKGVSQVEYMAYPRLPALAEVGWSPQAKRGWTGFTTRLAAQAPRWDARGMTYYRSTQIPW